MYYISNVLGKVVPTMQMPMVLHKPESILKRFSRAGLSGYLPALYTPFSDVIVSRCGITSVYLIHGVKFGLGAGLVGVVTSMTAGAVYRLVKKHLFPHWLKDQNLMSNLAQLSLRGVCHLAVGAAWGACAGLLLPSLGVTVATGIAIGNVTFIGYLIMRLAERILGLNRQPTQGKILEQLGLPKTAKAVYYYAKREGELNLRYRPWIRGILWEEIQENLAKKGNFKGIETPGIFNEIVKNFMKYPDNVEQEKIVIDRFMNCLVAMENVIEKNKTKEGRLSYMLLAELSLRVLGLAISGNPHLAVVTPHDEFGINQEKLLQRLFQVDSEFKCYYRKSMCNYGLDTFKVNNVQKVTINEIFESVEKVLTPNSPKNK